MRTSVLPLYDSDGFAIVKKISGSASYRIAAQRPPRLPTGRCEMIPVRSVDPLAFLEKTVNKMTYHMPKKDLGYSIPYEAKSWQLKAWRFVGKDINWAKPSGFIQCSATNPRLCKLKRVGISLSVYTTNLKGERISLADLSCPACVKNGPYCIADTYAEFKALMREWYKIMVVNMDTYLDVAADGNSGDIHAVQKAFIIYKDHTFDCVVGSPAKILEELEIWFEDGQLKDYRDWNANRKSVPVKDEANLDNGV